MWFVISIYWHRAPKNPFNFLSDRSKDDLWYPSQNSLNYTWVYANKMTFDKYLRVGVGCQGTNPMTGGWTFSHRLPTFRERKVTGDSSITNGQWFNQSCHIRQWTLYKKKKKKKTCVQRASRLVETQRCQRVVCPKKAWKPHASSHMFSFMHLFHLAAPEFYPFTIHQFSSK